MFSFLKQKIKDAVSAITNKFEKEIPAESAKGDVKQAEGLAHAPMPVIKPAEVIKETEETAKAVDTKKLAETQTRQSLIEPRKINSTSLEPKDKTLVQAAPPLKAEAARREKEETGKKEKIPVEIIKPISTAEKPAEKAEKKYSEEEATGFLGRITQKITTTRITDNEFEELFWGLEVSLLENNVAFEVIDIIKQKLRKALVDKPLRRGQIEKLVSTALRESVDEALSFSKVDFLKAVQSKRPYTICFVGINGSGKTTTIAKIAHYLKRNKISCVIAAGDTFRAAAIQQIEEHAARIGVKLIKHDYGSDAAAVAFDAIAYAKAHDIDAVLIDTAGRMQSNVNLMDEMKKIVRVAKPDMILFIGESITGNDCIEQARQFNDAVGITGIVLAKADVDEKGGAALSIAYVTGKPILFLGMGQGYDDLKPFSKEIILSNLGLEA